MSNLPIDADGTSIEVADRFLPLGEVIRIVGASRSTIYSWVANGSFPAPKRLGARRVGWLSSEVDAWVRTRVSARNT